MGILLFRFVVRVQLGETVAWVTFVFLQVGRSRGGGGGGKCLTDIQTASSQVYPRTFLGESSMYDKDWWLLLVKAWEAVVFNPGGRLRRR